MISLHCESGADRDDLNSIPTGAAILLIGLSGNIHEPRATIHF